MSKHIDES
jgi:regulator of protease activity HflC (stomatin/prohibitin superfamily)